MVTFRPATAQDASAIRKLIWRVRINPMGLDWRRFLVAVDEQGQLVACGQIKSHNDGTRELASIAVQPEWQGQGIGRAIVERLLWESSAPLYLTCRDVNEGFYRKFGFHTQAQEEMSPYFRRLYRLTTFMKRFNPRFGQMRVMMKPA